jgi:hypothetical protein
MLEIGFIIIEISFVIAFIGWRLVIQGNSA